MAYIFTYMLFIDQHSSLLTNKCNIVLTSINKYGYPKGIIS